MIYYDNILYYILLYIHYVNLINNYKVINQLNNMT